MSTDDSRQRLLIFIVAYNARETILSVLQRIPEEIGRYYDVETLIIDDASSDDTFEFAHAAMMEKEFPFPTRLLQNPVNQGYGGNQKIGYWYAMQNNFDYVALIHGDGQYAPESLPALMEPLRRNEADAVFGSRMLRPDDARAGGMPLYKFVGNRILTWFQNRALGTTFSEFHSGYRVYAAEALRRIPFDLNTNDFHFDTEIIYQLLMADQCIKEVPIPTYYGDEISHVNGIAYALNVFAATLKLTAQRFNLFYDRKYDCGPGAEMNRYYRLKVKYRSPHSLALKYIRRNARVLDLGCAGGYVGKILKDHLNCFVTGVDRFPIPPDNISLDEFVLHDLDDGPPELDMSRYDVVLLLDVIEHLKSPEEFVEALRQQVLPTTTVIVSTGNVAFFLTRLSLLLGTFNYGKRGILDLTHTRLFTFASLKNLFRQANYDILHMTGTPVPFPLVLGESWLARALLKVNTFLLHLLPTLFSFQSVLIVQPRPTLRHLLQAAEKEGAHHSGYLGRPHDSSEEDVRTPSYRNNKGTN